MTKQELRADGQTRRERAAAKCGGPSRPTDRLHGRLCWITSVPCSCSQASPADQRQEPASRGHRFRLQLPTGPAVGGHCVTPGPCVGSC